MTIYQNSEDIERIVKTIESNEKVDKEDKVAVRRFVNQALAYGISRIRIYFYIVRLSVLIRLSGKPLSKLDKDGVKALVAKIEQGNYSEQTKKSYKVTIKKFYQFLDGFEWNSKRYPEKVEWLSMKMDDTKVKKTKSSDILTDEDVLCLVKNAINARDKAFISVLYESGCRIGELLPMKISDITWQRINDKATVCILNVSGKSGQREILIVSSIPLLKNYLDTHPNKKDDSPLWVSLGIRNHYERATYESMRMMLIKLAKRTGITKPINPHNFRKSNTTKLSDVLSDQQLKLRQGWVKDSKVLGTYSHLTNQNVNNAMLSYYGIEAKKAKDNKLEVRLCPVCKHENSFENDLCQVCSQPLTIDAFKKMEQERVEREEKLFEQFKPSEKRIREIFVEMYEERIKK